MYKSAWEAYPLSDITPLDYGWKLSEDNTHLDINWFIGEQVPLVIEHISELDSESEDEISDEYDGEDSEEDDEEDDIDL